jgi:hypothetical protein
MKSSEWVVIVVVVFFLGFLSGYSLAPATKAGAAEQAH